MERSGSRLARNASAMALFPILGMLGGILLGVLRAWLFNLDPFIATGYYVRGGFLGSILGAAAAVAVAVLERRNLTSIRRLMILIAIASVVLWFIFTLLGSLAANGTL